MSLAILTSPANFTVLDRPLIERSGKRARTNLNNDHETTTEAISRSAGTALTGRIIGPGGSRITSQITRQCTQKQKRVPQEKQDKRNGDRSRYVIKQCRWIRNVR